MDTKKISLVCNVIFAVVIISMVAMITIPESRNLIIASGEEKKDTGIQYINNTIEVPCYMNSTIYLDMSISYGVYVDRINVSGFNDSYGYIIVGNETKKLKSDDQKVINNTLLIDENFYLTNCNEIRLDFIDNESEFTMKDVNQTIGKHIYYNNEWTVYYEVV